MLRRAQRRRASADPTSHDDDLVLLHLDPPEARRSALYTVQARGETLRRVAPDGEPATPSARAGGRVSVRDVSAPAPSLAAQYALGVSQEVPKRR